MITSLATVVLLFVAYFQLRSLARTSRSDFLYRLKKDFFTQDVRRLLFLVERDYLEFPEEEIPHFKIVGRDQPIVAERMKDLGIQGDSVGTYIMEDVLLGPLEDLGFLEKRGMVDFEEVYEAFETYFLICVECKALHHYFEWSRADLYDDNVYDNLLTLAKKLKEQGKKIRARKRWRLSLTTRWKQGRPNCRSCFVTASWAWGSRELGWGVEAPTVWNFIPPARVGSEQNFAANGHDCLDAHQLVIVTLRHSTSWMPCG
jgi:hypothetical protein